MSNLAEAISSTPIGFNFVNALNVGGSWSNGFSQLSRHQTLTPGTHLATARFEFSRMAFDATVDEPVVSEVRAADAYAYLDVVAWTAAGLFIEVRDVGPGADPRQELELAFEVDENGGPFGGPVFISVALGTVADSRGPALARADAVVHLNDFTIAPVTGARAEVMDRPVSVPADGMGKCALSRRANSGMQPTAKRMTWVPYECGS